jgi:heme-degrading monooxygenase HmoA
MASVVLINVFEVPEGKDEEFLAGWEQGKAIMERQPGYVSSALHRSLDPAAKFRYINVANW